MHVSKGKAGPMVRNAINFAINPTLADPYKEPVEIPSD
jgi:hypothetical protein